MEGIYKNRWADDDLYQMLKDLVIQKRYQRMIEERLFQVLGKVTQRRWMHERLQDQSNHEKLINHVVEEALKRKMFIEPTKGEMSMNQSVAHELEKRLTGVEQNIRLINQIGLLTEDFYTYKIIMSMLSDEYIYQTRLIKMINTMSSNLDLSCDNPCVRQMLMLHNILCEAYPRNCTVGYDTSCFRMDYR